MTVTPVFICGHLWFVALMHFGVFGINVGVCAAEQTAARIAQAAEAAGFESVWTGEHVVLPDPQAPPSPVPPETPFLDPAVALTLVAAHTTRLRLATGIIILPQRNPVVLAKELASVDVVSGGRFTFGVGIGYLKAEFDALGVSFAQKGARTIEYLEAIRVLWTAPKPEYHGRFVSFSGIQSLPRPVQQPHPPIVIGGRTPEAYRRAVTHGNGWYGFALDAADTAASLAGLRTALTECARPPELGRLEISITPRGPLDLDTVKHFAHLGVHRLIPYWPYPEEKALRERIARFGDDVIAKLAQ